jgi:hypothetical protein
VAKSLFDAPTLASVAKKDQEKAAWQSETQIEIEKRVVGPYYGKDAKAFPGSSDEEIRRWVELEGRPISPLHQLWQALVAHCTGVEVKATLTSRAAGLSMQTPAIQAAVDQDVYRCDVAKAHSRACAAAFLGGLGAVLVVPIDSGERVTVRGQDQDSGRLSITSIRRTDLIVDATAKSMDEHLYRMARWEQSRQYLYDTGVFPEELVKKLEKVSDSYSYDRHGGDEDIAIDRLESAPVTETADDMVEGWNVQIRKGDEIYFGVLSGICKDSEAFWLVEPSPWRGPGEGPIELVGIEEIPGQAVPSSPLLPLLDLDNAKALLMAKAIRQALETDTKLVVAEDADKLMDDLLNPRMSSIRGDPNQARNFTVGGLVADVLVAIDRVDQEMNNAGMGLQQLSGSGAPSKTATGVATLTGQIMVLLGRIKAVTDNFGKRICQHILHNIADDPTSIAAPETLAGGMVFTHLLTFQNKLFEPNQYEVKFSVSTPQASDPAVVRAQALEAMGVVPSFLVSVVQTGGNPAAAIRYVVDKLGDPAWDDIYANPEGLMQAQLQQEAIRRSVTKPSEREQGGGGQPQGMMGQVRSAMAPATAPAMTQTAPEQEGAYA